MLKDLNWVAQKQIDLSIDFTRLKSEYFTVNQNYYCQSL